MKKVIKFILCAIIVVAIPLMAANSVEHSLNMAKEDAILGCALIWMGVLLILVSIIAFIKTLNLKMRCIIKQTCYVTDYERYTDDEGTVLYKVLVRGPTGELIEVATTLSTTRYPLGKPVKLHFNPKNHSEYYISNNKPLLGIIIMLLFSVAFTVAGICAMVSYL